MEKLNHAIVGGPPDDWHGLRVFGADGVEVKHVIEVNAAEGWLIRYRTDEHGRYFLDGDECARERIEGNFTILRPDGV